MGLLDEAIREHLELKRRHGADPTEVARQEHEALGPARRVVEPEPEQPEAAEAAEVPEATPEPEPVAEEPEPEPELFEFDDEPEPEPEPAEPAAPPVEARRIDPDLVDQPTVEHPAARPEPEASEDDVLEGTPEFLEETPEHDRLWFEQRPPRDFDFDD
jgi:hypothetical protein